MQIYPDLSTKRLLSCLVFFCRESNNVIFTRFWKVILSISFDVPACLPHSQVSPASLLVLQHPSWLACGTEPGRRRTAQGENIIPKRGCPLSVERVWASHTDYPHLTQWFTCWWAQPCNYTGILTLHFELDSLGITRGVATTAWKLGKYGGGYLEVSSTMR